MKKSIIPKLKLGWELYIPITSFAINLIVIILILVLRNNIPPEVPLFYGKPQGVEQLASQNILIIPALFAIIITILNSLISNFIKDNFLQKVLAGIMVTVTMLSTITIFRIIFLVGSI